jgi:glycogen synthase
MNHLIISREYPPAPYPGGGIGTYVDHISTLLANHGETVHVIAQRSPAAPRSVETRLDGRLIVHRVSVDEPVLEGRTRSARSILAALGDSILPVQAFMWQAAMLAESLIETAGIEAIEAQDYEAPAYFLMLRRALGLGTGRPVPIIVQLHTPIEFVFAQNGWDRRRPDYLPQKRLEDYTIHAADALLCPSRFLAGIAERHYGLEGGSIHVLPYPLGDARRLSRTAETWADGSICFVGRMEPRKGIQEWIDAAVGVAAENPAPRFVFIGGDTSYSGVGDRSMREIVQRRIPSALEPRFTFLDGVPRERLAEHLAQARIAVVPSRWENFPNTCIEAMSSGLPVLVTPTGGMAEMVEDGRTGWIAEGPESRSLATALRRALATSPAGLERMGADAATAIRRICANDDIVSRHLEFRRRVADRGAVQSTRIVKPSRTELQPRVQARAAVSRNPRSGIAIVVTSPRTVPSRACIDSIASQSVPPARVVMIVRRESGRGRLSLPAAGKNWSIVAHADPRSAAARQEGLRATGPNAAAVVFLDDDWVLAPDFVGITSGVLERCPDVGIVSPWYRDAVGVSAALPATFPYQWVWNDTGPCAAFRLNAIEEIDRLPASPAAADDPLWDLSNAILEQGWLAAPIPAVLASRKGLAKEARRGRADAAPVWPSHELSPQDAEELAVIREIAEQNSDAAYFGRRAATPARTMTLADVLHATPRVRRELIRRAIAEPGYAVRWLGWHGRRAIGYQRLLGLVTAARSAFRQPRA